MSDDDLMVVLTILFAAMAFLYSTVGHAGSSGYQAAMGLVGVSSELMKPVALMLNVVVSSIATMQFNLRASIDWRQFFWLVMGSMPAAFLGGYLTLKPGWYYLLVGAVLCVAAVRLWFVGLPATKQQSYSLDTATTPPQLQLDNRFLFLIGVVLGFLSGLTGTGGGIFLTPLMILCGWSTPRQAAGLSAAFILANSLAGFIGWLNNNSPPALGPLLPWWIVTVAVFGCLGSWYGSKYGSPVILRRLLSLVLIIAGAKLMLQGLK